MRGKLLLTLLCAAIGLALLTPADALAIKKCYDCHEKEKQEYASRKIMHKPTAEEKCETCHKRHGFAQQLILQEPSNELCYSCHGDLREQYSTGNVHFPVSDGMCWDCHDPHSSNKEGLLREGPEGANDPNSCLICHKSDLEEALGGTVSHEPFADLNCIRCHAPHASPFGGLLVAEANELCGSCHAGSDEQMTAAHADMNVVGLGCTDCHAGHSTNTAGLLSANTHEPFASGDCEMCHSLPDADGNVALEEGVAVSDLCVTCHSDIAEKTELNHPHAAVMDDNCEDCHQPHSSRHGKLLVKAQRELCQDCHSDVISGQGLTPHMPVVLGECTKCHEVHGSKNASLLVSDDAELCLTCHEDFAAAHDSASTVHAAAEDCLACHNAHEGQQTAILRDDPSQLCKDCHEADREGLEATSGHQPYLTANCVGCHQPHHSDNPHLVRGEGIETCVACHPDVNSRLTMPTPHYPATEDCQSCHQPHYSDNLHLLSSREQELCETCHDYGDLNMTAEFVHSPAAEGDCSGCHNPHGSVLSGLITGRMQTVNVEGRIVGQLPKLSGINADLCYTCHDGLAEEFRQQGTHAPVAEGNCQACHASHGSDHPGFVKAAAPELCADCHAVDEDLSSAHGGYDLAATNCLECHNPHVSDNDKLVRSKMHPPFADESCDMCHEVGVNKEVVLVAPLEELCAACHEEPTEDAEMAHLHAPFASGDCTSCHGIHAADNEGMLKAEGEQLCFSCHFDIKDQTHLAVSHQPFDEGKCLDCHQAHASNFAALTNKPAESFCLQCHGDLEQALADGSPHPPAVDGECTACHEAHAGDLKALLVVEKDDLCGSCHDLTGLDAAHSGFPVAGTNCQNCHEAHVGPKGQKGLLLPSSHAPFAIEQCGSCHEGKQPKALLATPRDLCLGCHDDFSAELAKPVVHPPVREDDGCIGCHGPHVGYGDGIQVKEGPETCFTCHDSPEFTGKYQHAAAFEDCGTCHDVHAGDYDKLLSTPDIMELCTTCHEDAQETHYHPMGGETIDPRTKQPLNCVGCHSPHSSDFASILVADKDRKLCIVCHSLTH